MQRRIICCLLLFIMITQFVGCTQLPEVTQENSYTQVNSNTPVPSINNSVSPRPAVSPSLLPSPTMKPTVTIEPMQSPSPTVSPTEEVFTPDTDIPDIIEGDGKNSFSDFYEDDENIYKMMILDGDDNFPLCSINKITGQVVPLLDRCGSFCFDGGYIYGIGSDTLNGKSNISFYNISTKEKNIISTNDNFSYNIQVDNDHLYYLMYRNDEKYSVSDLYSMDINGGDIEKIIDNVNRYIIYNNNIFYVPYGNDIKTSIYMYSIDSKNTKQLDGKCSDALKFSVAFGKIYFYDVEEGCVISIDIESDEKKIFKDANYCIGDLAVVGQYLFYFTEYRYASTLRAYDIINNEYYDITEDNVGLLEASNKNLYFYDKYGNMKFIKISDGKASIEEVKGLDEYGY